MSNEMTLRLTPSQCSLIRKVLMDYLRRMNNLRKNPDFKDFAEKKLNEVYDILKQM